MIGCSSSPCSSVRSRAEASPRRRANLGFPSPPSRARLRRSSAAWGSSSSSAPPGRSPPPTPAKRCWSERRDALLAIDEAESAARGADRLSGMLRVALPPEYGMRRIVPLLPAFFARQPLLKIDLMMSDRLRESDRRRGRPCAPDRRPPGFELRRPQAREREAPLHRVAVLSRRPRRAHEPRRSLWPRRHQRPRRTRATRPGSRAATDGSSARR